MAVILPITQLPTELIIRVLSILDCQSLLACRQVCKFFESMTNMAELRYKVELAATGMEDGPTSTLLNSERLELLLQHQEAWKALRWQSETILPMTRGGVWEFYGGVIAQAKGRETLSFKQIPSKFKDIKEKEWECDLKLRVRDFTMDPAQDLLVVVESQDGNGAQNVHLLSLSTGQPHPQACRPAVLTHSPSSQHSSFAIVICSNHVGVLFIGNTNNSESDLVVWDWQSGKVEMILHGRELASFSFLSHQHVLVAYVQQVFFENPQQEPSLRVYDLKAATGLPVHIRDADFELALDFPLMQQDGAVLAVAIRADPAPTWKPNDDLQVPFHVAHNDRLFVLTVWVAEGHNITSLILFVPSSTALSRLSTVEKNHHFSWSTWGPSGSRMRIAPAGHSMVWVCYVYGQSFVAPYRERFQAFQTPRGPKMLQLFNFNQLAVQRALTQEQDENMEIITQGSELTVEGVFTEPITTYLPYIWRKSEVPYHAEHTFDGVMLGEDAIITVTSDPGCREYRILSF